MRLVVDGLRMAYAGTVVVEGVDLTAAPGEVVAIVGPNGCGKSTLLRGIARLHRPVDGQVLVGAQDIWQIRARAAAKQIALLPQTVVAPEAITVAGLVRYGRHPHQGLFRQWSPEDETVAAEAMRVTGVTDLAHRRLDQLSGGQRQRSWLAMVLAQQTPLLLLDEPTSALDLGHQVEVLRLLRKLASNGQTIVMVLHDLASAARYADKLIAMRDGRVVASGPPRGVVTSELVRSLYDIESDVLAAPGDGAPVVVPRDSNRSGSSASSSTEYSGSSVSGSSR